MAHGTARTGGFLASFPVSKLLKHTDKTEHVYFGVAWAASNFFSVLTLIPAKWSQILAACLFGPVRCLNWAAYFQFLATERRYPPSVIARAMGYDNVAVAVAGALGPYLLTFFVANIDFESPAGDLELQQSAADVSAIAPEEDALGDRYVDVKVWLQIINAIAVVFPMLLYKEYLHARCEG